MDEPAVYADPHRLAACLDYIVSEQACARMLGTERLQVRLSKLLEQHYRLSGFEQAVENEVDQIIALATATDLEEIALRAGAIYWAGALAGTILGPRATALHGALGAELCAFGLANRDLAGPLQPLDPVEGVRGRVLADGWRCVGAWCHASPISIGARVRLKLPPDELIDDLPARPFDEAGPGIVRRAAGGAP
ncbi:MAG: hypothetical protein E5W94_05310 [Mesorhizobium sp.]|nr:MAG: hypothetical protein E5W94_05310 [Mesorhizobium sp.]